MSSMGSQSDLWKHFGNEFDQLAREEEQIERIASRKDRLLRAYCDYKEHREVWEKGKPEQGCFCLLQTPEAGLWTLSDGVNENFQARCRALVTRTGVALGAPEGPDPEDFWLHRLFLDLLENNSDQLFAASREGGVILRVCVASATFCARLERKALGTNSVKEQLAVPEEEKKSKQGSQTPKPQSTGIIPGQFQGSRYRPPKEADGGSIVDLPENPYFPNLWPGAKEEVIPDRSDATITDTEVRTEPSFSTVENNTKEAFIDRAIASRKRMLECLSVQEGTRHADTTVPDAQQSRALLGIELAHLEHLRRGVWKKFFDEASIPRVVEAEWQSVLSLRKMPDSSVDLGLTFALMKEYQKAISRASAQLADLLATAAGSRINQAHLREAIWREGLDFAYQLGQWDAFATWVDRVVHVGWQTLDADGQPSLTPDRECDKRLEERRNFFERRSGMYSRDWLSAIDEPIELRLMVSAAHTVNASGETGKQAKAAETKSPRIDPEVAKRVALVKANPGIPANEICETFDRENVPLPTRWLAAGLQTWSRTYKNSDYRSRIDTIISKDRAR